MLHGLTTAQITQLQGMFAAKLNAEETHSLTLKGYSESFAEFAKTIGVKPEVISKSYGDYKFATAKPLLKGDRDTIMKEAFNL